MIDPTKNLSVQPAGDFAALKLDKAALNPQPLPPKGASAYADGAVIAARTHVTSLNPQPLPPQEIAATGASAVNPAVWAMGISTEGLPQQIGKVVSDVLSKVALNPQPLPPKAVGSLIADLIGKIGIIIVSGKGKEVIEGDPEDEPLPPQELGRGGIQGNQRHQESSIIIVSGKGKEVIESDPEDEPLPPQELGRGGIRGNQRHQETSIIIVSGKGGKVSEEDPDGGDPQARFGGALALQSVSSAALNAMIEESIRHAATAIR